MTSLGTVRPETVVDDGRTYSAGDSFNVRTVGEMGGGSEVYLDLEMAWVITIYINRNRAKIHCPSRAVTSTRGAVIVVIGWVIRCFICTHVMQVSASEANQRT
jgi:hypothetical protein